MNHSKGKVSRRRFIESGARAAGLAALGGSAVGEAFAAAKASNGFGYDLSAFSKTDPKLLAYEQVARFPSLDPAPRRIAIGVDDRVHIAGRGGVMVLGKEGGRISQISTSVPARCVAVAEDGRIYAGLRDHVEVFGPDGERQASWAIPAKKAWLTGLAWHKGELFVADSGSRLVWRLDGKVLGRLGDKDKERNVPGLIVPSPYLDVAVGADGRVRVNNPGRHCVETYTVSGDLELSWGKPTAAIEGFCGCCNPIGLALLPDGRVITCEKGLPRVKVHAADGSLDCVVAGTESFPEHAKAGSARDPSDGTLGGLDAAVDSAGRVYILDLVTAEVRVMRRKAA